MLGNEEKGNLVSREQAVEVLGNLTPPTNPRSHHDSAMFVTACHLCKQFYKKYFTYLKYSSNNCEDGLQKVKALVQES